MKTATSKCFRKLFFLLTLGIFLNTTFQAPAMAGMIGTSELDAATQVELKKDEIRSMVAREDVRTHLLDNGVSEDDINSRIDAMTDAEVLAFHAELDSLPAGEGALGTVIAIIVIFMLLDIAGVTDIFPGI